MKISEKTLKVLRGFAHIHTGISIKKGYNIATVNPEQNLVAGFKTEEQWPIDFSIYDLGTLLGTLSLFNDPDLKFNNNYLHIKDNNAECNYYYCDSDILHLPPGGITVPDIGDGNKHAVFKVTSEELNKVLKAAGILASDNLTISGVSGNIGLFTTKKDAPNKFTVNCQSVYSCVSDFQASCKIAYMRFYPGDYDVSIIMHNSIAMAEWQHTELDLRYFVGMENTTNKGMV